MFHSWLECSANGPVFIYKTEEEAHFKQRIMLKTEKECESVDVWNRFSTTEAIMTLWFGKFLWTYAVHSQYGSLVDCMAGDAIDAFPPNQV